MIDTKISNEKDNGTSRVADIVDRFTSSFKKEANRFTSAFKKKNLNPETPTAIRVSLDKEGNFRPECLMPGAGWQGLADALMPETWASECSTSPVGRFIILKNKHNGSGVKLAYCISQKSAKTYYVIPIYFRIIAVKSLEEDQPKEIWPDSKSIFSESGIFIKDSMCEPIVNDEGLEKRPAKNIFDPSVAIAHFDMLGDWITQFLSNGNEKPDWRNHDYFSLYTPSVFERNVIGSTATLEDMIKMTFIFNISSSAINAARDSVSFLEMRIRNMF